MENKKIIITTAGNIPVTTKKQLTDAGVIIIEAKDPDKIKVMNFADDIFTHDLLMAALKSVTENNGGGAFAKELNKRLIAKEDLTHPQ